MSENCGFLSLENERGVLDDIVYERWGDYQMKVKSPKYQQMCGFFRARKVSYIRHFSLYSFPRQGARMCG